MFFRVPLLFQSRTPLALVSATPTQTEPPACTYSSLAPRWPALLPESAATPPACSRVCNGYNYDTMAAFFPAHLGLCRSTPEGYDRLAYPQNSDLLHSMRSDRPSCYKQCAARPGIIFFYLPLLHILPKAVEALVRARLFAIQQFFLPRIAEAVPPLVASSVQIITIYGQPHQ